MCVKKFKFRKLFHFFEDFFHFNSWLSFQRLCRLLRGYTQPVHGVASPRRPSVNASTQWSTALDALDTVHRIHRCSMTCAITRTMSCSTRRLSGRTTYCMPCFHRHRPRRSDTTSDYDRISCNCLSIWLSCLIVVFWYACCTKILTDFSFSFLFFILYCNGLRYVMTIDWLIDWLIHWAQGPPILFLVYIKLSMTFTIL